MKNEISFDLLYDSDLIRGYTYKGGPFNNISSEPISKCLPVGNQSGIRFSGKIESPLIVVLYSTFQDKHWPDTIDGDIVTYYGDNKSPGCEIHDKPGNKLLRSIFNNYYLGGKTDFPPIYLFSKGEYGFDRVFQGLLKPGHVNYNESEDLVAIWKTKDGERFQNYKAKFTLLPNEKILRTDFAKRIIISYE